MCYITNEIEAFIRLEIILLAPKPESRLSGSTSNPCGTRDKTTMEDDVFLIL
jgi:hypothetical protein